MSAVRFFDYAVTGFRAGGSGRYPRSRFEAGIAVGLGALFAVFFGDDVALRIMGFAWAIGWAAFYMWAFVAAVRIESRKVDIEYDRRGKFALSKEYWDTESATSAKARKKKRG